MISGKRIVATAGGIVLRGQQSYESTGRADKLDGQTGSDNGFSADEPGSYSRDIVIEFVQDSQTGIFVELAEGNLLTEVKVYNDYTSNVPLIYMPYAYVFECQITGRVKERLTQRVTISNYKQYALNNPGSG